MSNKIVIKKKIESFKKNRSCGDKSLSIRWIFFSLASGVSKAKNLLMSDDVLAL